MADQPTESVILELRLNADQYKQEQKLIRESLAQLVLGIEKTKQAQKDLDIARKAGKLTDEAYSRQSVLLREELKGQQDDYRNLSKGLENSQKVMNAGAGSIVQLRARLSELTEAYNNLSQAERDNSEEGQRLQAEARAVSEELKKQEGLIGDNRRNVGGYAAAYKQSFAALVAELAKVTAAQKQVDAASEQGQRLQQQRIGFMTAAQKSAAQAGITDFAQAQATIEQYSQALGPAAENLVRLQQEQQQVGQTAGENSEQYQALGFKIAGAEKSLADLVSAQEAAAQAARNGGAAVQGQAAEAEVAAGSLADLRRQLVQLQNTRETLDPTTKEAQELNTQILELRTNIQQAEGKIDEFGERVQKNIKKENFDTVSDAIQGMAGATAVATLVFGENSDAAAAQAKALQLMTIAQNARAIAIGLDSAKDAAQLVLLKAKSLFIKEEAVLMAAAAVSTEAHAAVAGADAVATEAQAAAATTNAEAQAAGAEATVASTVATEAQVVVTEGATIAQRALNLALKLNPIGLIILAISALVGLLAVYRNSSEATQQKIRNFTETLLRFATPVGLLITSVQRLYERFELVRRVLDPVVAGFKSVAGWVEKNGRSALEYIGILDTQAEKLSKLAEQEFKRGEALRGQAEAEIVYLRAIGTAEKELTQQRLASVGQGVEQAAERLRRFKTVNQEELDAIKARDKAGEKLSDKQKKLLEEVAEREKTVTDLVIKQEEIKNEAYERDRSARAQAAADIESNTERAVAGYRRQLTEAQANQQAALQSRLATLDRGLAVVQHYTNEELELQRKRIYAQRDLELANLGPTLAQERTIKRKFLAEELTEIENSRRIELAKNFLTEQEKASINQRFSDKAADVRLAYSTAQAQREIKARQNIQATAAAAETQLTVAHLRQNSVLALQAQYDQAQAELAAVQQGLTEQAGLRQEADQAQLQRAYALQKQQVLLERELALAQLNTRTDNTAAELRIRAEANRKLAELEADQAETARQRRAQELNEEARQYDLLADGMLAGHSQAEQRQVQATETYKQQRIAAVQSEMDAQLATVTRGGQEEVNIRQEAANKIAQIQADSSQTQLDLLKAQTDKVASIITSSLNSLAAIQDADSQAKLARIDAEMNKEGVSAARKGVLEKQKLRAEQQAAEQRKKIARAQAVVQLGAAIMTILAEPSVFPSPAAEIAKAAEIVAATATAYAQFRAMDSAKFARGGIAYGPSHAQGGIQLTQRGRAVGIEIEGGEAIINRRSTALFGPVLSAINQLGGGRAFYVDPKPASEWARLAEGGIVPRNLPDYLPQVRTGGVVVHTPPIDYDALAKAIAQQPSDHEGLASALATKLTPAFIAGAQALPAQQVNLTELRQRNNQLDKQQAQTDI